GGTWTTGGTKGLSVGFAGFAAGVACPAFGAGMAGVGVCCTGFAGGGFAAAITGIGTPDLLTGVMRPSILEITSGWPLSWPASLAATLACAISALSGVVAASAIRMTLARLSGALAYTSAS